MDKRIIWFALIVIIAVAAILFFRNGCRKPIDKVITPHFSIDKTTIAVGDSIYYEDHTEGATSWFWDFGDGTTSKQQKGYNVYYESNQYNIKLTVNGAMTDSSFYITVNPKNASPDQVISERVIVTGPRIVYVGKPVTFTDNTPGAQHTNWQNMVTYEKKLDSKTYTTTFMQKGDFTIIATNEKNTKGSNGQGIITGKIIEERSPAPPAPPAPVPGPKKDPKPTPPPPAPAPSVLKQNPSNEQLKTWFTVIAAGKGRFSDNYKPVKDGVGDESLDVEIINNGKRSVIPLNSFCQGLTFTHPKIVSVAADWDQESGFKKLKVIVEEK